MNWKVLGAGVVVTVPLLAILASGFGLNPRVESNALEGQVAPNFELQTLEGDRVSLSELRGKPVVINFWATWCQPCLIEHQALIRSAQRFAPAGVTFLGVLYNDEPAEAVQYLKRKGSAYPTLIDINGRTAIDYGVAGVPETFFIDAQGTIAYKATGPVNDAMVSEILGGLP